MNLQFQSNAMGLFNLSLSTRTIGLLPEVVAWQRAQNLVLLRWIAFLEKPLMPMSCMSLNSKKTSDARICHGRSNASTSLRYISSRVNALLLNPKRGDSFRQELCWVY